MPSFLARLGIFFYTLPAFFLIMAGMLRENNSYSFNFSKNKSEAVLLSNVQKILVNEAIYNSKLDNSYQLNMLDYVINQKQNKPDANSLNDDTTDAGKM